MVSLASDESEKSAYSMDSRSYYDGASSPIQSGFHPLDIGQSIDDLMDQLVAEATQQYASDSICRTTTTENKEIVYKPEQQLIDVAIKKLTNLNLIGEDAGKSYYELRIMAGNTSSSYHGIDELCSVLIGYACLDGYDSNDSVRRYTFQDSQHLFKLCELLGEKGRFEDAAY